MEQKKTVVILEPNPGFRFLFQTFFHNELKWPVVIYEKSKDIVEYMSQHQSQIAFVIISIDVYNTYIGAEVFKKIREMDIKVPFIAAGIDSIEKYNLLYLKESDYFKKDFTFEKLAYNKLYFIRHYYNPFSNNKLKLKLFVSENNNNSLYIKSILEENQINYSMKVIDIKKSPEIAEKYKIFAVPLLIREHPLPAQQFYGVLKTIEELLDFLI